MGALYTLRFKITVDEKPGLLQTGGSCASDGCLVAYMKRNGGFSLSWANNVTFSGNVSRTQV